MRVETLSRVNGFAPVATNSKLGIMYAITKALLEKVDLPLIRDYMDDDKMFHLIRSKLYYYYSNDSVKLTARNTSVDEAWKIIPKVRENGYSIFMSKTKVPSYEEGTGVFVVRSAEYAMALVVAIGRPVSVFIESDVDETPEELFTLIEAIRGQGMVSWTNPNPPHLTDYPDTPEKMDVTIVPSTRTFHPSPAETV